MKRVVLPKERRVVAMHLAHDSYLGGNCGVKKLLENFAHVLLGPMQIEK